MDEVVLNEWGQNPRIKGTRITVYTIVHYLEGGWEPGRIAEALQLTLGQVMSAVHYIDAHRGDVMAVHRRIEERNAKGNPPEVVAKLNAAGLKLQAMREALRVAREEAGEIAELPR